MTVTPVVAHTKTDWSHKKLNELGFVGRGRSRHRPRNEPSLYGGAYPFVQTGEIKVADLYITTYSQTYNEKGLAQSKLWDPGTLLITIAANIAETAILKIQACFPDSVVGFIANPNESDVRFIKYYIDTLKLRMQNVSRGTTQDNLPLEKLLSFDFFVPPLPVQRKIAAVLSAYDGLIEINTRRIRVLEEMARAIYREWFVKFRFPGYQNVRMVDSALGPRPEEWIVGNLGELVDFNRGVEPGSKNYFHKPDEGRIPFLRVGDLSSRDSQIFVDESLTLGKVLANEDIAITLDGSVGIVRFGLFGAYSTGIRKIVVHDKAVIGWAHLYCLLNSDHVQSVIQAHAKGTTILHAGSAIDHMRFVLAPASVIAKFEDLVAPMLKLILTLSKRIEVLRQTRDLLLPRLVSGEVDVSELDIPSGDEVNV